MKLVLAIFLVAFSGLAAAHKVPTSFPSGATPLSAEALSSAIEGREFTAKPTEGPSWHLKYQQGGGFEVRAGEFSDEGTWSTNQSSVCTEGKKLKRLCNEIRTKDGKLFLQRKGGEVMQLLPR